jgi:phosphoadenosine phosphosulfate reductase
MSVIGLYARPSAEFDARVAHTLAVLESAAAEHRGRIVQATSLGAEDMVVTDLIVRQRLDIALATLDTGVLHDETLALRRELERHYGITVEIYRPRHESVVAFVGLNGEAAMYRSVELRKACCAVRKLEPLSRMLGGRSAWVTGLRREQSSQRGGVPFREVDDAGRTKFNPIADWSWGDVWHYIATQRVPYNLLHDAFYPSIGCAPCTRAIAVGEDFRAGRWWWELEGNKECGLHSGDANAARGSYPRADEAPHARDLPVNAAPAGAPT